MPHSNCWLCQRGATARCKKRCNFSFSFKLIGCSPVCGRLIFSDINEFEPTADAGVLRSSKFYDTFRGPEPISPVAQLDTGLRFTGKATTRGPNNHFRKLPAGRGGCAAARTMCAGARTILVRRAPSDVGRASSRLRRAPCALQNDVHSAVIEWRQLLQVSLPEWLRKQT